MGGIIKRLTVLSKPGALPAILNEQDMARYGEQLVRGLAPPVAAWAQQQGAVLARGARFDALAQLSATTRS